MQGFRHYWRAPDAADHGREPKRARGWPALGVGGRKGRDGPDISGPLGTLGNSRREPGLPRPGSCPARCGRYLAGCHIFAPRVGRFVEGAVLGWFQVRVLRIRLPAVSIRRWILLTGAAAALAWSLGLLPWATSAWQGWPVTAQFAAGTTAAVVLLVSIGLGQWIELRHHIPRVALDRRKCRSMGRRARCFYGGRYSFVAAGPGHTPLSSHRRRRRRVDGGDYGCDHRPGHGAAPARDLKQAFGCSYRLEVFAG